MTDNKRSLKSISELYKILETNMKYVILFLLTIVTAAAVFADDIAVTVYNNNLGVVSENRTLDFQKGMNMIAFKDVPALIDVASVRFELNDPSKSVAILEQNYAYDLVSPDKMYQKYIDKEIELVDKNGNVYKGTLLSAGSGAVTISEPSGKIKIIQLGQIVEVNFPVLPEGLITRPTLFWKYNSDFSGKAEGNISYQTSGMNWNAEYVGLLTDDDKNLDLTGWASINNQSGKTYKDATLKLIAGDIHRATSESLQRRPMMKSMAMDAAVGESFEEKQFFEYHMYTLPRKATVADKENKQISLFEPASTSVDKIFLYRPDVNAKKVEVAIKFKNSKESGLGMPLPAGRVRLFKADTDGTKILLGEDRIDHTPKDEKVSIKVGYAFDITADYKMVSQKRISDKVEEQEYEITLNNRKDTDVEVEIEKKLYGFWEIITPGFEYEKKDASTITFKQKIEQNGSKTVNFKVRFSYR